MGKATATFTDTPNGTVNVSLDFDPPAEDGKHSAAQLMAVQMLQFLSTKHETTIDEPTLEEHDAHTRVEECPCGGTKPGHSGLPLDGDPMPSCLIDVGAK